jgi:DNA-binding beta-propeller fold protein YncE
MFSYFLFFIALAAPANPAVKTVDFAAGLGVEANALGPQQLCADPARNRLFIACANSSAVAVLQEGPFRMPSGSQWTHVEAPGKGLFTIPVGTRMPRRLRAGGMKVSPATGKLYVLGERKLIVVDADKRTALTITLTGDFEAMALDGKTDVAYLAGRTCAELAVVDAAAQQIQLIPYTEAADPLPFMAASAPPPIRFPYADPAKPRVYVVDGALSRFFVIDVENRNVPVSRELELELFPRWHDAGFDPAKGRIFAVVENAGREARHALSIDINGEADAVVDLPEKHTEPAGVNSDPARGEVYIPYDNMKLVHVVAFGQDPEVVEVAMPGTGMDASVYDPRTRMLYVTGWNQAALYYVDMATRERTFTVPFFPVYPHMNSLAFNAYTRKLYVPTGSTAVNGTFGAAVTRFDTRTHDFSKVKTGWGPVSLIRKPNTENFYVFGSEDQFAEVKPDGSYTLHGLPHPYPHQAIHHRSGESVLVAYGPHSSMWPQFYIGGTRNGIFTIDRRGLVTEDRMTRRLVQGMCYDKEGQLWIFQNTWGKEAPFLMAFPETVEAWPDGGFQIPLPPKIDNECVLRLLEVDAASGLIYAGRTGNLAEDNGTVYAVDPLTRQIKATYEVGVTPTDLCIHENRVYVTNFDGNSVSVIHTDTGAIDTYEGCQGPIAVAAMDGAFVVLNHLGKSLEMIRADETGAYTALFSVPLGAALPGSMLVHPRRNEIYVTAHTPDGAYLLRYDTASNQVTTLHQAPHPYGEVTFDQANAAFGVRAQWGDALFRLNEMAVDENDRLWVTDYLAGKLWIVTL